MKSGRLVKLFLQTRLSSFHQHRLLGTSRNYNLAITRQVPQSFVNAISTHSTNDEPINIAVAQKQHEIYVEKLRCIVPTLCLPSLEAYPDSVFLEDTVVTVGKKAVITNMGHQLRRGEESTIRDALLQLGMNVVDMKTLNPKAFCDGGDVLFTGRHLFVGVSERTNHPGLDVLQEVFDNIKVVAVPLGNKALHLKSVITHLDDSTLLAPTGHLGDFIIHQMKVEDRGYSFVRIPELQMCNVVSLNGKVLAQDEMCRESRGILQRATEHRHLELEFVNTSEFAKCDGALTCCSILLSL